MQSFPVKCAVVFFMKDERFSARDSGIEQDSTLQCLLKIQNN